MLPAVANGVATCMPGQRILIVDDEAIIRDLLVHNLIDEGYVVDGASTVAEAWRMLASHEYALVVTDWRLPDGNGLIIADAADDRGAKAIIMSGYLLQMAGGRSERHETLVKPVRPSEILAVVKRAIGEAQQS